MNIRKQLDSIEKLATSGHARSKERALQMIRDLRNEDLDDDVLESKLDRFEDMALEDS